MKTKVKVRKGISKGIVRICSHNIEWRLNGKGLKLWDMEIEQIQNSLIENYMSGDLRTITPNGNTVSGWWSILY
ncbi:MAG: hypothetical protein FWC39_14195 [Bacteroidetes bacterium]|nr:hypothetical protein [Bacteroidota bacterium]